MRILVACEYSGRVRNAFIAQGHEALSCDLLPSEQAGGVHYQGDIRDVLYDGWDLMVCHPPCTYLASSGLHWNTRDPGRAILTEESLAFVQLLLDAPIHRIALENPIGCISSRVRKPEQIIQPWQFGEDASKATCLWLKNLPPLIPTRAVAPRVVCCGQILTVDAGQCRVCFGEKTPRPRWGNQTDSGQNKLGPSQDRWKERSRTFQGVADAMAWQWDDLFFTDYCAPVRPALHPIVGT